MIPQSITGKNQYGFHSKVRINTYQLKFKKAAFFID